MTLRKTTNKGQIGGAPSDSSETTSWLTQGDSFSTLLFGLTLEEMRRNVRVNPAGGTVNTTRQCMAYADGDVITGRSMRVVNEAIREMEELTYDIGLKVSADKTA